MRILVVHNYYQHKGGEDVVFQQEVEALQKQHQVETITFQNKKGFEGLKQFVLYPWNISAANKIVQKAKNCKADIVHIHNTHYAIGPLVFRKLHKAGFKVVQTLHNYRLIDPSATLFVNNSIFLDTIENPFPWKSVQLKTLDNSFFKTFWVALTYYLHHKLGTWRNVDRYLVFSNFMKELILKSSKKIQNRQIALKVNAIEKPNTMNENRAVNFVFIGRLSIEKGIETLLLAFEKRTEYTLEIYGDGPLVDQVKDAAIKNNNIKYKGFKDKEILNKALATCQALIVPSIWFEGMPMTILEAYSLGTPVIGSKIGALSEMIIDGKTGFHFEYGNPQSLWSSVDKFSNLPKEEKQTMSNNCINEFLDKYQLANNIESLEQIYSDVLNENKKDE